VCEIADGQAELKGGEFWMEWPEFSTYFATVEACKLHRDWAEARFPMSLPRALSVGAGGAFPALRIETFATSEAEITLQQRSFRSSSSSSSSSSSLSCDLGLVLVRVPRGAESRPERWKWAGDSMRAVRSYTSVEAMLDHEEGSHLLALPCVGFNRSVDGDADHRPGPANKTCACVFSAKPLLVSEVNVPMAQMRWALLLRCREHGKRTDVTISSSWSGTTVVGRCWSMTSDAGSVIAVESVSPEFGVEISVTIVGHNVGCSRRRDETRTSDFVPPQHSQVIRLDTQLLDGGYSLKMQMQYKPTQRSTMGHQPPIVGESVHNPFPNYL
jgi:hypothetical protein